MQPGANYTENAAYVPVEFWDGVFAALLYMSLMVGLCVLIALIWTVGERIWKAIMQPDTPVIIRAVYTDKAPKPKHDADLCTNTDYIGCIGIVEAVKGDQALVNVGLTLINGDTVYNDVRMIFGVSMLEVR